MWWKPGLSAAMCEVEGLQEGDLVKGGPVAVGVASKGCSKE
jgi:hypothetical protein